MSLNIDYGVIVGTHDIHALILGRAITGLQSFTVDNWAAVTSCPPTPDSFDL